MSEAIEFFVKGTPVPKGSAKAMMLKGMKFPVVFQDNAAKQKPWAKIIRMMYMQAAMTVRRGPQPKEVPIKLSCAFFFERPQKHRNVAGALRPSAPRNHTVKPDLDKLIRCVKDALTTFAYQDDSQVVELGSCTKSYCPPLTEPGVKITVQALDQPTGQLFE